jgi:hypothetical protein
MDKDNILTARGKLLEEMLDPRVTACSEAMLDLATQRGWTNGFLTAVALRALMRTVDLQESLKETKLQAEIVTAASELAAEYANDNFAWASGDTRVAVDRTGDTLISVPKGTEMTTEIARQMVAEQLGVPVDDIEITKLRKLN